MSYSLTEGGKYKCSCGEEFASYHSWYSHNSRKHMKTVVLESSKSEMSLAKPPAMEYSASKTKDNKTGKAVAVLIMSLFLTVVIILYFYKYVPRFQQYVNSFLDKTMPIGEEVV